MEKYNINKSFIRYLLTNNSQSLVGKTMKRFETITNKEELKQNIKDLIYEQYRDLESQIFAFSKGLISQEESSSKDE